MKISIRLKLFFWLTGLICFFVLLSLLLNNQVLERYYVYQKEKNLEEIGYSINEIYEGNPQDLLFELEFIERRTDTHILILSEDYQSKYDMHKSAPGAMPKNERGQNPRNGQGNLFGEKDRPNGPQLGGNPPPQNFENYLDFIKSYITKNADSLKQGEPITLITSDPRIKINMITLVQRLKKGDYLVLNTPLPSIEESARIANNFFLFTGLLTMAMGSLGVFLLTRRFTKPLLDLNIIAQKMSQLDFSTKYTIKSGDEFEQLGQSVNSLSYQLNNAISELREANAKLQEDILKERKIDEMRREFVSSVSHELKTPIALIQGYAEGLKENVAESQEDKDFYCQVISDEANRLGRLVNELLNLSQIESGFFSLEKEDFDLVFLVENIIGKYRTIFDQKGIQCFLESNFDSVVVYADPFRVEQILINFINNAIQYINLERIIKISISSVHLAEGESQEKAQEKVALSVFNTGPNLQHEELEKIWHSFYKTDKARKRDKGGTGLGLSIVRVIQEKDNNRYGVRNLEKGVEFWIELTKE